MSPSVSSLSASSSFPPTSPSPARRKRATPSQRSTLLLVFSQTKFPDTNLRNQLAKSLGMTPRSVQVWFQNQRQRTLTPQETSSSSSSSAATAAPKLSSSSSSSSSSEDELEDEDEELAKGTSKSSSPSASPRYQQHHLVKQQQPVQLYQVLGNPLQLHQQQPPASSLIPSWLSASVPPPSQMVSLSSFLSQIQAASGTVPSASSSLSIEPPRAPSDRSTTSSSPTCAEVPFLTLPPLTQTQSAAPKKANSLSFLLNPPEADCRLPPLHSQHLDILSAVACGSKE